MEKIKNKKGVSDVITTVLIILLVLAAVAIIGGILLRNIGQAGSKIETSTGCVELDLQPVSCSGTQTGAGVLVQRGSRGSALKISKLAAVVEKSDGTTTTGYATAASIPNALATTLINVSGISGGNAKNARVSATLQGADGTEQTCEVSNVLAECKKGSGGVINFVIGGGVVTSIAPSVGSGTGYQTGAYYYFTSGAGASCGTPAIVRIDSVSANGALTAGGATLIYGGLTCSPAGSFAVPI